MQHPSTYSSTRFHSSKLSPTRQLQFRIRSYSVGLGSRAASEGYIYQFVSLLWNAGGGIQQRFAHGFLMKPYVSPSNYAI